MTMVPAPKLSKPHFYFYGTCGGGGASDVMTRFSDGCSGGGFVNGGYNIINGGGSGGDTNTTTNIITTNINKVDNSNNVDNNNNNCILGSDLGIGRNPNYSYHNNRNNIIVMAEEEQSRISNTSVNDDAGATPAVVTSSTPPPSHHLDHRREGDNIDSSSWLQLGLGGGTQISTHLNKALLTQVDGSSAANNMTQMGGGGGGGGGGLMLELNLGGGGGGSEMMHRTTPLLMAEYESRVPQRPLDFTSSSSNLFGSTSGFLSPHHTLIPSFHPQSHPQQLLLSDHYYNYHHHNQQQQQQIGWGYANQRTSYSAAAAGCSSSLSPSSSSSMPPAVPGQGGAGSFLTRPFTPTGSLVDGVDSEFRVIHPPPRRLHSGIWFNLQASLHQSEEPFLPQVSKSFLRIKDGRMTVRLVMKYLANKLGLDSESEVEIRCRGQQVETFLTLEYVRDNIWSRRDAALTLLPDSSTSDHLMVLNYGRTTFTTTTISSTYLAT